MKLTGLLKNKVEEANTKEEKREIIAEAGMELTDDELVNVAGGRWDEKIEFICSSCKKTTMSVTKPPICPNCGGKM